jgi:hypothetical protein
MKIPGFIILFLYCNIFIACNDSYEKKLIGKYRIAGYSPDTIQIQEVVSLDLLRDRAFLFIFKKDSISGKWEAGDDGDRTWIRFRFNGGRTSDAQVVGKDLETISVWNPGDFLLPQLTKLDLNRMRN